MGRVLRWIFNIAGLGLGVFFIWSEVTSLLNAGYAMTAPAGGPQEAARLTFTRVLGAVEQSLLYFTLVLLPGMYLLNKLLGHKLYSALVVLVFAGLCVLFAQVLHASVIDGYVFYLSQNKHWPDLTKPAAILIIIAGNWLMAFAEMYTVVKVGGK